MMEAFEGETKVHIIDINSTYCTQWPMLIDALAYRAEGSPHLRLTTIVISAEESTLKVMKQIMARLERFARLMGVPFECTVTHQPELDKLDVTALELRQDEALAVSCNQTLHRVSESEPCGQQFSPRDIVLCTFRDANPKVYHCIPAPLQALAWGGNCPPLELYVIYITCASTSQLPILALESDELIIWYVDNEEEGNNFGKN